MGNLRLLCSVKGLGPLSAKRDKILRTERRCRMIIGSAFPSTQQCCLRIIDDILDETRMVEIPRDQNSVIADLLLMQKTVFKLQKAIRLCVHITHEVVTLHWWAEDLYYTRLIVGVGEIPRTFLECLQEGKVWK
jgi:hypothetical protein